MLLRSSLRSAVRSAVRFGPPAKVEGAGTEPLSVVESIKYAFLPMQNRAAYGSMSWPRLDYGPHRRDYGRVGRPQGVFPNLFFALLEFPMILKEDQWAFWRFCRHSIGLGIWVGFFNWLYFDRPV